MTKCNEHGEEILGTHLAECTNEDNKGGEVILADRGELVCPNGEVVRVMTPYCNYCHREVDIHEVDREN